MTNMNPRILITSAALIGSVLSSQACWSFRLTRQDGKLSITNVHDPKPESMGARRSWEYLRSLKTADLPKDRSALVWGEDALELRRFAKMLGAAGFENVRIQVIPLGSTNTPIVNDKDSKR